jgi:hypothetical protein
MAYFVNSVTWASIHSWLFFSSSKQFVIWTQKVAAQGKCYTNLKMSSKLPSSRDSQQCSCQKAGSLPLNCGNYCISTFVICGSNTCGVLFLLTAQETIDGKHKVIKGGGFSYSPELFLQ